MSPVGHSLVGLTLAVVAMPKCYSRKWLFVLPVAFVALASLPDWPLPNWGHDRYDISHSIFVNAALIGLAIMLWRFTRLRSWMPASCVLLGVAAWLSHLLLDSFYNHGRGVAIYWPFSEGRLNFSMPWFNTLDRSESPFSAHNVSVYAIELLAFSPILIIAVGIRALISRRVNATKQEEGG